MENDDLLKDDFLGNLVKKTPEESPSDGFVESVMANIGWKPELAPVRKPFYLYLKSSWPYILLSLFVIVFVLTSDLPFSKFIPGMEYFTTVLLPYLGKVFSGLVNLFGFIKSPVLPIAVVVSAGLLILLDYFLFRRPSVQHHFSE